MNEKIILEKLKGVQEKYNEIEKQLSDPQVISDQKKFEQIFKHSRPTSER